MSAGQRDRGGVFVGQIVKERLCMCVREREKGIEIVSFRKCQRNKKRQRLTHIDGRALLSP